MFRLLRWGHFPTYLPARQRYFSSFRNERPTDSWRTIRPPDPPKKNKYLEQFVAKVEQRIPIRSRRFWVITGGCTTAGTIYYVAHLEEAPVTGRRQFIDISPEDELKMGEKAYIELLNEYQGKILPSNHPVVNKIRDIGMRIVERTDLKHLKWRFHVVNSPLANAFVLPSGKVFVFSGILPILKNDDGIAAVLGHEIAHQVARHSAEKMSFGKIISLLSLLLMSATGQEYHRIEMFAVNLLMNLPFSRKCEIEADYIGLLLMAQACFDPNEAALVWKRMSEADKHSMPQFLSTHPSSPRRIETIEKWIPEANKARDLSNCIDSIDFFRHIKLSPRL